jgi:hypothetical protein
VGIGTRNKIKIGKDAIRRAEGGRRTGYDPFLGRGTGAQTSRRRTEEQFGKPVPGSNPQGVKPKAAKKTKKNAPKKPVTPSERATGSRRGVPVGTNQKTNAIKRAAAAKKKKKTKKKGK